MLYSVEKRILGSSGIEVSILGYGAGNLGNPGLSEQEAIELLHAVLDSGVTLIDTARSYGLSEERIGKHLKGRRNEFVLSTKVGYGIPGFQDWTGPCITAGIEAALRLLQTDCIDIVHLHSCPQSILEQGDVVRSLLEAKSAGKIRVAAYSGDNEPFDWALASGHFGSLQTSINVCDQRAVEKAAIATAKGIGVIAKRTLANAPWLRSTGPHDSDQAAQAYRDRWNAMALDTGGLDPSEFALRFAAYVPGVTSCLMGTRNVEHLRSNVRMIEEGPLPEQTVKMIRETFNDLGQDWTGQV
jgi:aryl-alcohol dehydrogenase-like predicted oxidoreductase